LLSLLCFLDELLLSSLLHIDELSLPLLSLALLSLALCRGRLLGNLGLLLGDFWRSVSSLDFLFLRFFLFFFVFSSSSI